MLPNNNNETWASQINDMRSFMSQKYLFFPFSPAAKQSATLSPDTPTPDPILCTVRVTGAYPLLSVTDVQGEGVACGLSKAGLWTMLSIDQ